MALDTSALMAPVERDLRLFDELDRLLGAYELVTPAAVRRELAELAASAGGKAATAARVGADLAERAEEVATAAEGADDAVVELAEAGDADLVATMDRPLAERVLAVGVPVAAERGRHTLEVIEP
ncbi:MAG: DUF188 domain-containing protein [Halobacteriales archaeon]|nr:DUF188 domain-containing protein [Halobacteriales archaeon]